MGIRHIHVAFGRRGSPAQTRPVPSTFKPDTGVWQKYVGDYATGREPFRIYVEGGKLMYIIPLPTYPVQGELVPYSDSDFLMVNTASASDFDLVPMSFKIEADGSVTVLVGGRPAGVKK